MALGLGSALVGATAARVVFPHAPASALLLAGSLGALGAGAGLRTRASRDHAGLEWIAVLGALACLPAAVILAQPRMLWISIFLAPPVGLALAALWWSLLAALRGLERGRTLEDVDVAEQLSGRWVAAVGGVCAPAAFLAADMPAFAVAALFALWGTARAIVATRARTLRARFLKNALEGRDPRFRVVDSRSMPSERSSALPSFSRTRAKLDGVLVARSGEGPYRDSDVVHALARVPLCAELRPPTFGLAWDALRGTIAILGALFAPLASLVVSAAAAECIALGSARGSANDAACGWLLLLSGPATGAALLVLSHLHRPVRAAVWWLGIGIYLLTCPLVCLLLSFAARWSAP
jgi:hypothetical protein